MVGTFRCCGGRGSKGARGVLGPVHAPPTEGTWMC
jgi:hypothetical protein